MFRLNRSRFLGIICLVVFIYFLLFTDSGSSTSSDFRTSTEASLARIRSKQHELPLRGDLSDEDLTKKTYEELQGILSSQSKEGMQKDEEGNNMGRFSREDILSGTREEPKKKDGDEPKKLTHNVKDTKVSTEEEDPVAVVRDSAQTPKYPNTDASKKGSGAGKPNKEDAEDKEVEDGGDPSKDIARERLMEYLKSPIVIFSKSYCPHSKRAKHLLLEIYNINPKPLVVELDMLGEKLPMGTDSGEGSHVTLGKALQDLLGEISGRKTVPNIMLGGIHSIGGNDKIWELHDSGLLAEEIKKLGGRKLISVDTHDSEDEGHR